MKKPIIFVCEFITAGGLSAQDIPASLFLEGQLTRDALLEDIATLNLFEIITCHDYRTQAPAIAQKSVVVEPKKFNQVFDELILEADYVWLIAPEIDGVLLELTRRCFIKQVKVIGCGEESVKTASYKSLTAEALQRAGIPTLPVYSAKNWLTMFKENPSALATQKWIVKADDGAGCDAVYIFEAKDKLAKWLSLQPVIANYICQPYQSGIDASFSMLCNAGKAWLLSVNKQHLVQQNNAFKLSGLTVNAFDDAEGNITALANKIAQMLPDAAGYMGVDILIEPGTNHVVVIEVNPRLTSSYVGLGKATGQNMAELILNCVLNPNFSCENLEKNKVEIAFE
jgi:predicted ATP-grasp superfamily ATP-dependent carboligase